ncbi:MAG: molybdopterin cofactor-binding domain-containing protein [Bryobacterales bacterium]
MKGELNQEPERYELREPPRFSFALNRRLFLGSAAGAGLLIGARPAVAQNSPKAGTLSERLEIGADGRITAGTSKVETGQGSRAELTQAVAEELAVAPDQIRLIMADTARTPDDGGTAGSRTTPSTVPAMRQAAAAAREVLIGLAAKRWGVDKTRLTVRDGAVRDEQAGRSLSYADLASASEAALREAAPDGAEVVPTAEWRVLGSSLPRPNAHDIVTGRHRYPSDIRRPGMLYGHVLRPPAYGARLESIDLARAEAMRGVKAVRDGAFVGCAAPTLFEAKAAVAALAKTAQWTETAQPSSGELFDYLEKHGVERSAGRRDYRSQAQGLTEDAFAGAKQIVEARFEVPYVQHAPMEPRAACAEWEGDKLTVWTGTQQPSRVQGELAEAFRIPESSVRVIVPDMGGGFGGKHTGECAVEAARLAKAAGRPVQLRWTREEEFTWAYFRPAALIRARGGLDANGKIVAWEYENLLAGTSGLETPYDIANKRQTYRSSNSPLRVGSYRALGSTANNFGRECLMDELAQEQAKIRSRFVSPTSATSACGPCSRPPPSASAGRNPSARQSRAAASASRAARRKALMSLLARRLASRAASIALNASCRPSSAAVINPDNLRAQNEGCIVQTLGAVLHEQIRFRDGRLLNGRFSQLPGPAIQGRSAARGRPAGP